MRDYAPNNYGRVDDTIYGGGTGMMIRPEPVFGAYEKAVELCGGKKPHTVYMSPKGSVFNQAKAHELASYDNLLIICGHYEGIDARVIDEICDEEISIGDYVLTGGETAAIVVIDAVARLIPGVLPNEEAYTNESHTAGVLEAPQYTKPPVWHDKAVPEVLKNGNDAKCLPLKEACAKILQLSGWSSAIIQARTSAGKRGNEQYGFSKSSREREYSQSVS